MNRTCPQAFRRSRAQRSLSGALSQTRCIVDQDAFALQTNPASVGEVRKRFVDRLTRRTNELGEFCLGQIVVHTQRVAVAAAESLGEVKQLLGNPPGHIGEDEVRQVVVGAAQPARQHSQQPLGNLGPVRYPTP